MLSHSLLLVTGNRINYKESAVETVQLSACSRSGHYASPVPHQVRLFICWPLITMKHYKQCNQ